MESRLTKMDGRLNQLTWMVGFVGVVVLASTGLVMGIAAKLFLHRGGPDAIDMPLKA